MSVQRHRRCTNIEPLLGQRLPFVGLLFPSFIRLFVSFFHQIASGILHEIYAVSNISAYFVVGRGARQ